MYFTIKFFLEFRAVIKIIFLLFCFANEWKGCNYLFKLFSCILIYSVILQPASNIITFEYGNVIKVG